MKKRINIRIHRDIEGKMWFGGGINLSNYFSPRAYPLTIYY
jgi:hypothetical protein